MSVFYFLLGATPALSGLELALVTGQPLQLVGQTRLARVELPDQDTAVKIFQKLGGSIKLYAPLGVVAMDSAEALLASVAETMATTAQDNSLDFGVVEYGPTPLGQFSLQEVKQALKAVGIRSRYLKQDNTGLPAAVLLHQARVQDFCVLHQPGQSILAQTIAIQDIDDWTLRDRSKPYADRKKGMLPPKLARIMVNLAVADAQIESTDVLLDPFCGSGTILMESALAGVRAVGSDLDATAVAGSLANAQWLTAQYTNTAAISIVGSDATNLHLPVSEHSIRFLVTEPFLGKPTPKPEALANIFKGLEKLYLGAFKHWTKWLVDGARVVVVFPYVQMGKHTYSQQKLIDKLGEWGYTLTVDPVMYARPQAVVQRQIAIFTWKQSK